jgi:5'-phosphate synthase pdxT subunit
MLIGVLAMQGAFREHQLMLSACGVDSRQVRKPEDLNGLDGLIIPGGESTTISKLLADYGLFEPLKLLGKEGMPVFGTCAGAILLAKEIEDSSFERLRLMDIRVKRNAFGRQLESFEEDLEMPVLTGGPFRAVFIRAPHITGTGPKVEALASYGGRVVCARQGSLLAAAFHPELTVDRRLHEYFLNICKCPK